MLKKLTSCVLLWEYKVLEQLLNNLSVRDEKLVKEVKNMKYIITKLYNSTVYNTLSEYYTLFAHGIMNKFKTKSIIYLSSTTNVKSAFKDHSSIQLGTGFSPMYLRATIQLVVLKKYIQFRH